MTENTATDVRAVFEKQLAAVTAGDLDSIVTHYTADAVLVRADRSFVGADGIREAFSGYLALRPRLVEMVEYAEHGDTICYRAVMEVAGERKETVGTMVMKDGGIWRQTASFRPEPTVDATPLEIYRAWNDCLLAGDVAGATRLIDADRWTEKCLGLTGWLTDFQVALTHYARNMVEPWEDLEMSEEEVVEGRDAVTIRFRVEATHIGEFMGVPATGRRVSFDAIRIVHVRDGKVTGQWAQLDLWGLHRQLTDGRPTAL
ncbi:nuclear transport factor 2 family protein [Kitasatospora sp. NPDC086791]|uniref:nuclear transport factor 2 family protein n=1 Tax=Kitasatospora sp. NPDC086791 TaxID=3155178 RepID=UPI00341B9265